MKKLFARLAVLAASVSTGAAFAALPGGVSSGLSTIQADGIELVNLIWPVIIALVGAAIVMKLFKRFVNKV